jgi:pantetheine-phosphate adenylyltransferase
VTTAACPGSFDPVTNGHLDIISRAARLFDGVRVAVLVNPSKQGMFSVDDRVEMLREATSDVGNVTVESFDGLLVDYCSARAVDVIVKGVRAPSDVESELAMAQMNNRLSGVETVLIPTSPQWSFVASSLVKQVAGRRRRRLRLGSRRRGGADRTGGAAASHLLVGLAGHAAGRLR